MVTESGGADFRNLPTVPRAQELIDTAFGRAKRASAPRGAPGMAQRNQELARIGTAAKTLEARLNKVVRTFPSLDQLHPFYRDLVGVLVGIDPLKKSLGSVGWAHARVQEVRRDAERKLRGRAGAAGAEAVQVRRAAYGRMASFVEQVDKDLEFIGRARDALKGLPLLDLDRPILVVAGYPNVGKSSFLDKVSKATPEIAAYPFTTKGVVVGHADWDRERVQIVDTPGLLDRPLERRNDIEKQAILALRHAADTVLFLFDPSGHCGYPLERQEALLSEVRALFPHTPILEVENKADLEATGTRPAMSCEKLEGVEEVLKLAMEATIAAHRASRELRPDG